MKEIVEIVKNKNKELIIGNLNPERDCFWVDEVSYVFMDLRLQLFADNTFDSISCISTLEHIGLDNTGYLNRQRFRERRSKDYLKVVKNLKRILKNGSTLYITVPFGKYQDLKWMQVFDEKMINNIIQTFNSSKTNVEIYKYRDDGWQISNFHESMNDGYENDYKKDRKIIAAHSVACIEMTKLR